MMSFPKIGSVQNYMKQMEAKSLWQQRKQNGYYDNMREVDSNKAAIQEQVDQMHSQASNGEIESIATKLKMGKSLNAYEMEKLRQKNPELYEKAKKAEQEKKEYEDRLERCRTKEEVQRLKMEKLSASASKLQSVMNNPHIPDAKKLEITEEEKMKIEAINEAERKFVARGELAKLPTEAEVRQAEQEKTEQEKAEATGREEAAAPEELPETEGEQLPTAEESAPEEAVSDEKPMENRTDGEKVARDTEPEGKLSPEAHRRVKHGARKAAAAYKRVVDLPAAWSNVPTQTPNYPQKL